jgi:hypothetical protein
VVPALRDRADLAIDLSSRFAADPERLPSGRFTAEPSGLRVFVTSVACRRKPPRDAAPSFDLRLFLRPKSRTALPVGAPASVRRAWRSVPA